MSRPLKVQIVERARELVADEQNWCQRHLAQDVNGASVSPTSTAAVKRCGLGAVIAAAYPLTHDYDAAHRLGHEALRPQLQPRNTDLPQRHQRSFCRPRVVRRSYRSEVRPCVRVCLDAPKYPRPKGLVPCKGSI